LERASRDEPTTVLARQYAVHREPRIHSSSTRQKQSSEIACRQTDRLIAIPWRSHRADETVLSHYSEARRKNWAFRTPPKFFIWQLPKTAITGQVSRNNSTTRIFDILSPRIWHRVSPRMRSMISSTCHEWVKMRSSHSCSKSLPSGKR
jgi:hypothetical protein